MESATDAPVDTATAEESTINMVENAAVEGMEDNFVSNVLGNYFERFTAVVNSSHQSFLEHNQRLLAIKADLASVNARITANRRDMKKRMQNAVHVTDALRYCRRQFTQESLPVWSTL
jgi:hypothetical protein